MFVFVFQEEDGIRDLVRSRGLGDVYKRQVYAGQRVAFEIQLSTTYLDVIAGRRDFYLEQGGLCLLYTSDAADERSSVDLGGRRIIKKKTHVDVRLSPVYTITRTNAR